MRMSSANRLTGQLAPSPQSTAPRAVAASPVGEVFTHSFWPACQGPVGQLA